MIQDGQIVATNSPDALKSQVGGDVLDIVLDDQSNDERERARTVANESGLFVEGTVKITDDGLTVTAGNARRAGTDLLVTLRNTGFTIVGFDIRSPTLDDVFLAITGDHVTNESIEGTDPTRKSATPEVGQ